MTRGMELEEAQPTAPCRWRWEQHPQATYLSQVAQQSCPSSSPSLIGHSTIMTSVCLQDGSILVTGNSQDTDMPSEKEGGVLDIRQEGVMEGPVLGVLTWWQV